jgi:tetratricopeptide (TPR) repeat protein
MWIRVLQLSPAKISRVNFSLVKVLLASVLLLAATALSAQQSTSEPNTTVERTPRPIPRSTTRAPRSDEVQPQSSSKDTKVDLAPPKGDASAHPNSSAADDVMELHTYNPMKAMKDVEVGDYYYKIRNYPAAISRYREALEYKPSDAVATFGLAQALDKSGQPDEARAQYEAYLKILPNGPQAAECRKSLDRLSKPTKAKK